MTCEYCSKETIVYPCFKVPKLGKVCPILASFLAKNVTYCTNSTKLDKISVRMARTQPGCVGKFSVVVLILMFTKQKN